MSSTREATWHTELSTECPQQGGLLDILNLVLNVLNKGGYLTY